MSTIYISCPAEANATLGIKLPFLVMIIKNLKKYFSFEVQVSGGPRARARPHSRTGDGGVKGCSSRAPGAPRAGTAHGR